MAGMVPGWLVAVVQKHEGLDPDDLAALASFYGETQVVIADRFDTYHHDKMRKQSPELNQLVTTRGWSRPTWVNLVQDEYLGLYKASPEYNRPEVMKPTHLLNHSVLTKARQLEEWRELRSYTALDEWASVIGAVEFGRKLAELLDEIEGLAEAQTAAHMQDQRIQATLGNLERLVGSREVVEDLEPSDRTIANRQRHRDTPASDPPGGEDRSNAANGPSERGETVVMPNPANPDAEMVRDEVAISRAVQSLLDELRSSLQEYKGAGAQLVRGLGSLQGDIDGAVLLAVEHAIGESRRNEGLLEWFSTEQGGLQRIPAGSRLELAHRISNNRRLRELAEKVGRFVRLAIAEQSSKIIHAPEEVYELSLGADLNRLAGSELVMLTHPTLKREFNRRFAERELLQYELRGAEKVARGAIICLVDSSGSMEGPKDTWARAVAIALLNVAARQGRDFHGIIFGSKVEIMEFIFPRGKGTIAEVLDFAEFSFLGGTDFMTPLDRAVGILESQMADSQAMIGDIVMITDDECQIREAWQRRFLGQKARLAFSLYTCLIGFASTNLKPISDRVYSIRDFTNGNDAKEIFGSV